MSALARANLNARGLVPTGSAALRGQVVARRFRPWSQRSFAGAPAKKGPTTEEAESEGSAAVSGNAVSHQRGSDWLGVKSQALLHLKFIVPLVSSLSLSCLIAD